MTKPSAPLNFSLSPRVDTHAAQSTAKGVRGNSMVPCLQCGKQFEPERTIRKYCSQLCYRLAQNAQMEQYRRGIPA